MSMAIETVAEAEAERGRPKTRVGVVTSNKMQKTVVVRVERRVKHAKYGKYLVHHVNYKAHDEANACGVGDRVRIAETRPLSKDKRWRVVETLVKAEA
ncbi:MAG: 30S ribosomal protein S17 [Myxococcales bacterium]